MNEQYPGNRPDALKDYLDPTMNPPLEGTVQVNPVAGQPPVANYGNGGYPYESYGAASYPSGYPMENRLPYYPGATQGGYGTQYPASNPYPAPNQAPAPNQIPVHKGSSMDYTVDMVFCIDATGSMEDFTGSQMKIINLVKQNAINFYSDFSEIMDKKGKKVQQLRVRVVAFRDYIWDEEDAMLVTDFFLLPQQAKEFEDCVNSLHASGGGDIPEDGLEALAYAIRSNWTTEGSKKRQVIVVWTDAGTHDMGYGRNSPYYPNGMPADMSELNDWWDDMNNNAKRLILFAPDENSWSYISRTWDNTIHIPSAAGNGLAEKSYGEILGAIANSV